jgi:hypothetical protein
VGETVVMEAVAEVFHTSWEKVFSSVEKALYEVRAQESRALAAKGYEPVLKRTRWLLLKRPENLSA